MPNTSATGGVLIATQVSIDGVTFDDFMQTLIASTSGLTGDLVRPRWQPNPPKIPASTVNWCAFGVINIDATGFSYFTQGASTAEMKRHETFDIMATYYGPNAREYATAIRDGLEIGQNREGLFINGIAYLGPEGSITHAPEQINDIWLDRYDITLRFAREIRKTYNVLPILTVNTSHLPSGVPLPLSGGVFKVER